MLRNRTDLDKAKSEPRHHGHCLSILVKAGGKANRAGELDSRHGRV
jgi:hypothetical protein